MRKSGLVVLAGMAIGSLLKLGFVLIGARLLSVEQYGLLMMVTSLVAIGLPLSSIGLHIGIARMTPRLRIDSGQTAVEKLSISTAFVVAVVSAIVSISTSLIAPRIGATIGATEASATIRLLCAFYPLLSVSHFLSFVFRAHARPLEEMGIRVVGPSLALLATVIVTPLLRLDSVGMAGFMAATWICLFVISIVFARKVFRRERTFRKTSAMESLSGRAAGLRELLVYSLPLSVVPITNRGAAEAYIFFAGATGGIAVLAVYGLAIRLANQVSFFSTAANNIIQREVAEAFAKADLGFVRSAYRHSALLVVVVTAPLVAILLTVDSQLLAWIGEDYVDAERIVTIICLANLLHVSFGANGLVLRMGGNSRLEAINSAVEIALHVLALWIATRYLGPSGLPWAFLFVKASTNVLRCAQVYHIHGFLPFSRDWLIALGAASVALLAARTLVVTNALLAAALGSATVIAVYVAILQLSGLLNELRKLVGPLRRSRANAPADENRKPAP